MEVIPFKFDAICRTCMKANAEPLEKIFHLNVHISDEDRTVSEVLASIASIQMEAGDNLPQGICTECLANLVKAYSFQQMCVNSDTFLRNGLANQIAEEQKLSTEHLLHELLSGEDSVVAKQSDDSEAEQDNDDHLRAANAVEAILELCSTPRVIELKEEDANSGEDSVVAKQSDDSEAEQDNDDHLRAANAVEAILELCSTPRVIELKEEDANSSADYINDIEEQSDNSVDGFNNQEGDGEVVKSAAELSTDPADIEIEKPNPRNRRSACHTCEVCGKSFDRHHRLRRHMNVHKEEGRPYECSHCKRRFIKEAHLKRHAITHENNFQEKAEQQKQNPEGYKCPECPRKFLKQESLASHMRTHRKNIDPTKSYPCDSCPKVFSRLYRLTRHRKLHEENRKFSCDICEKTFGLSSHLIDHLNKHSGVKPHVCHYCDKSFLQACTLKDHLRTHTGEQPFLCAECGKPFNNASNLRQHQLRHTGIKRYQCPECPSKFTCKGGLSSHMSTHRNQKPFVCDTCGSRFTKHYSLKKHERIHTGEKPYKCDYCEMRFICSDHMKRHRRTHTGEKPYACKYCDRSFAQSNDMIKHLRSHVGENVYKCDQCEQSFRLSTELRRHITEHYKVDKALLNDAVQNSSST